MTILRTLPAALALLALSGVAQAQPTTLANVEYGTRVIPRDVVPSNCNDGHTCIWVKSSDLHPYFHTDTGLDLSMLGGGGGGGGTLAADYALGASTADSLLSLDAVRGGLAIKNNVAPLAVIFDAYDFAGTKHFLKIGTGGLSMVGPFDDSQYADYSAHPGESLLLLQTNRAYDGSHLIRSSPAVKLCGTYYYGAVDNAQCVSMRQRGNTGSYSQHVEWWTSEPTAGNGMAVDFDFGHGAWLAQGIEAGMMNNGGVSPNAAGFVAYGNEVRFYAAGGYGAGSEMTMDTTGLLMSSGDKIRLVAGPVEFTDGSAFAVSAANEARVIYNNGSHTLQYSANGAAYLDIAGSGTVTSVAMSVPSILSVAGSPITISGTLAVTLATETANTIFAGPTSGGAATPTFRAMVAADIPATAVTAASYTYASITVDAAGRLTAASNGTTPAVATRQIISGGGITGGGDLSADRTLAVGAGTGITVNADDVAIANTAVTPGSYGDSTHVATFTVDQQGRLTAAGSSAIGSGTVTSIASANTTVTLTPDPIVATGTVGVNQANAFAWTGSQTWGTSTTPIAITQGAASSGTGIGFKFTGGAHTALTASTEVSAIKLDLSQTVQHATGALTTQRALQILAPTYSFVGASTITDAATVDIDNAPQVGTNATLTNAWALRVQAGAVKFAGSVVEGTAGPVASQQHTLPAVASDTFALLAASQTFTNKTLTGPVITTPTSSGAGAWDLSGSSGTWKPPTGGLAASLVASSAAALTITGHAASTWSTDSGNLSIDSAATLNLGITNATGLSIGKSGTLATVTSDLYAQYIVANGVGANLASAATITPTNVIHALTGTTSIDTITVPANIATATHGGTVCFLPFGAAPWTTAGNIKTAGTAVVGKLLCFAWSAPDGHWWPSYTKATEGTVTSVASSAGITGGTITTSGTLQLDLTYAPTWTGSHAWTTSTTPITVTQAGATSGSPIGVTLTGGSHTTLAASTEASFMKIDASPNVQFATGALTTQRAIQVLAPTYAFVGASTLTTAVTFDINGAPNTGTNATITNAYAFRVQAGASTFGGNVSQTGATTFSTGTSTFTHNGAISIASGVDTTFVGGVSDFDASPSSGFFKTPTGAVTIGNGAISVTGAITHTAGYSQTGANTFSTGTAAVSLNGLTTLAPSASSSGVPVLLTVTGPAHTAETASTEAIDINFNLARTVQHATGALATQRAMYLQAPTYSFVGSSTLTDAVTLEVSGAPATGTNATITNAHAIRTMAGQNTFRRDALHGTSAPGLVLQNATVDVDTGEFSPSLDFVGAQFAGGANRIEKLRLYAAGNGTTGKARLVIQSSYDGAAYADRYYFDDLGFSPAANFGIVYTAGTGAFDASAASGTFKTSTGAHTFNSAAWAVSPNLVITGSSSATNTAGFTYYPNVATGATSIAHVFDNATSLTTAGALLAEFANAGSVKVAIDKQGFIIPGAGRTSTAVTSGTWTVIGACGSDPCFKNSWVDYGSGYSAFAISKDAEGRVWFRGGVKSGSTAGAVVITLPAGFRPAATALTGCGYSGGAFGPVNIDSSGNVTDALAVSAGSFFLDGCSFLAEQ